MNNLANQLRDEITNEAHIVHLLDDAAFAERFLSKPKPPKAPTMYDLITTSYSPEDIGFYKRELKLRATPRQISRWEFAIDALLAIEEDISKEPLLDRQIVWMRANRFNWSQCGRYFGFSRHSIR